MLERTTINEQNNTVVSGSNDITASVYLGYFKRGQAYKPMLVVDEPDVVDKLGEPIASGTEKNQVDFFTVTDYLKFVAPLYVVRTIDITSARNASLFVGSSTTLAGSASDHVKRLNDDISPLIVKASTFEFATVFYCAYPALDGNRISIAIGTSSSSNSGFGKTFGEIFNGVNLKTNEFYFVVGSGTTVLEKAVLSKNENAKDETGSSIFIDNVLKRFKYVRSYSIVPITGVVDITNISATALSGGYSEPANQSTDLTSIEDYGIQPLYNKEKYSFNLIIDNHLNTGQMKAKLIDLAGGRGETGVIVAPAISEGLLYSTMHTPADVEAYYTAFMGVIDGAVSNAKYLSYSSAFLNFKIQNDKYNGVSFINSYSGEVAGTIVKSLYTKGLGVAVAGIEDGLIFSSSVMIKKWNSDDRQVFATNRINPIIRMPQFSEFPIIYDYLTMINEESILNKFHSRLILNEIKRTIRKYSKQMLIWNKSSESVRNKFVLKLSGDLTKFKNSKVIVDYRIKDTTSDSDLENNTVRFTINLKIAGLMREIFIDLIVVSESVDLNERLVA